jgi:hypothetical protein
MNNNNKKGLSTIVATLLIILLTLVAVGIIWVVVRNVIQGGSDQIEIDSMCIQANVVATGVINASVNATGTTYNVSLSRQGGDEVIGGVKLVFTDAAETSSAIWTRAGDIEALGSVTEQAFVSAAKVANPNKVSVVVYFLDSSGNEQFCQTSNDFEF